MELIQTPNESKHYLSTTEAISMIAALSMALELASNGYSSFQKPISIMGEDLLFCPGITTFIISKDE